MGVLLFHLGVNSRLFNFNYVQRTLVLEDCAPPALRVQGFVSRKKGASSMGEEKKEGGKKKNNNKKCTGKINMKKKRKINIYNITKTYHNVWVSNVSACLRGGGV